jgi:gamma-glutamyl-gamma-aminobutyrate hydrolase PuuD
MSKVYVSGGITSYYLPHINFGEYEGNLEYAINNPDKISLVVLPGGADVSPDIYGHPRNPHSQVSPVADNRDSKAFDFAVENGIPIAGICRGGQFLIAKAGGYLYQHTTGHVGSHLATTYDGIELEVTSTHHQMFGWPLPEGSSLLMWSKERRSRFYENGAGTTDPPPCEPECVFLPKIKALATQWHPEWMNAESNGSRYYQFLLEKYVRPLTGNNHLNLLK